MTHPEVWPSVVYLYTTRIGFAQSPTTSDDVVPRIRSEYSPLQQPNPVPQTLFHRVSGRYEAVPKDRRRRIPTVHRNDADRFHIGIHRLEPFHRHSTADTNSHYRVLQQRSLCPPVVPRADLSGSIGVSIIGLGASIVDYPVSEVAASHPKPAFHPQLRRCDRRGCWLVRIGPSQRITQ